MKDCIDLLRRVRAAIEKRRTAWPGHAISRLYLTPGDHQAWLAVRASGELPDELAALPVREGKSCRLYLSGGQSVHVPTRPPS